MSWSTSELRVRLAPLNRFKPFIKIFYWPFKGGTYFVDLLCFCSVLCLLCLCARLFICALWSSAGKGLTSWLSFVVSTMSLSLSHWYPGSIVVLDCIDSWSLHPYLLLHLRVLKKLQTKLWYTFGTLTLNPRLTKLRKFSGWQFAGPVGDGEAHSSVGAMLDELEWPYPEVIGFYY